MIAGANDRRDGKRLTNDAIREVASELLFEKCRRGFDPAQMAGLHVAVVWGKERPNRAPMVNT